MQRALLFSAMLPALACGQDLGKLSFSLINWKEEVYSEGLVSADGVLIAYSDRGDIFRSLDTGMSWQPFPVPGQLKFGLPLNRIHFDRASGLLYGFDVTGTYVAVPRAKEWVRIHEKNPVYDYSIEGPTLIYLQSGEVNISRDGGKNWTSTSRDRFPNTSDVLAAGSCVYVANYDSPLSFSCDGGNTWKNPNRDTLSNSLRSLASYQGAVIAVGGRGLIRSLDSGKTWARWQGNMGSDSALREVRVTETSLIVKRINPIGFSRSVDGGLTWVTHAFPDSQAMDYDIPALVSIGGKLIFHSRRGLKASVDGGGTWVDVKPRTIRGIIQSLAVQDSAFFAFTDRGIFVSRDTGITWDLSLPAAQDTPWVAFIASGGVFAAGSEDGKVRLSSDSGAHWSRPFPLPASAPVKSLAVFGGSVLAASAKGIWRFTVPDSGWNDFPLPVAGTFQALGYGPTSVLVATEAHLWRMRPDGSYDDLSAGIETSLIKGLWIIDDHALAYTTDGFLRRWDPVGSVWINLRNFDLQVRSLASYNGLWLATSYSGIFVSRDSGVNWQGSGTLPFGRTIAIDYSGGILYAGDGNGGIWKSTMNDSAVTVLTRSRPRNPLWKHSPLGILHERGRGVDGRARGFRRR